MSDRPISQASHYLVFENELAELVHGLSRMYPYEDSASFIAAAFELKASDMALAKPAALTLEAFAYANAQGQAVFSPLLTDIPQSLSERPQEDLRTMLTLRRIRPSRREADPDIMGISHLASRYFSRDVRMKLAARGFRSAAKSGL